MSKADTHVGDVVPMPMPVAAAATAAAPAPASALASTLAHLPSVERLMSGQACRKLSEIYGRTQTLAAVRAVLEALRGALRSGAQSVVPDDPALAERACNVLQERARPRLRSVFNLTGTVLHTNLGRALLPEQAVRAVVDVLTRPVNLEFDLGSGARGDRDDLVGELLCELTGAQAATVVNNNAAAVLLMLAALAPRREVIVSRGELVEIGGAFRIPDIMSRAGAKLREVGTTNRTHLRDYEEALGARTALLMKVHTSNYAIQGFTHSVEIEQLAPLARERGVPLAVDLGSGTLVDLGAYGLPREATVRDTLAAGADLVTFSGDKLLGGPQAGLIVGRADLIAKIKKHPLKRALRVGKLTLAALEPVLQLYRAPELLRERLTTLRLLTRPITEMQAAAVRLQARLQQVLGSDYVVESAAMFSQIGSGALPIDQLSSAGLVVRRADGKPGGRMLSRLEAMLRALPRPVIGRIADNALQLDLRCLEADEEAEFAAQLGQLVQLRQLPQ